MFYLVLNDAIIEQICGKDFMNKHNQDKQIRYFFDQYLPQKRFVSIEKSEWIFGIRKSFEFHRVYYQYDYFIGDVATDSPVENEMFELSNRVLIQKIRYVLR